VLSALLGSADGVSSQRLPNEPIASDGISSKRMADGKEWTTANVSVDVSPSYCYDDREMNCRRYGRLYTWQSAQRVCQLLGAGWRLPTDGEWRRMTKRRSDVEKKSNEAGPARVVLQVISQTSSPELAMHGDRIARRRADG